MIAKPATMQTSWEETHEEAEQRRLTQSKEAGWAGTIVGVALALVALGVLLLGH